MNTLPQTQSALTRLPTLRLEDDRIIVGSLLKYIDTRGGWLRHDGAPLRQGAQYLGLGTRRALQRFVDQRPEIITERAGEKLPSADELNEKIPKEEWPIGLTGEPSPPWQLERITYLIDVLDLTLFTYSAHTIGGTICTKDLESRWEWARALYGSDVMPLFKLIEMPFPTAYGERKRPAFEIVGWRKFTEGALRIVDQNALALESPKPKSLSADLKDNLPF